MNLLIGETSFISLAAFVSFALLSLALITVFVRLVRGPSLADRVVALDLIAFVAVTFIALYSITTGEEVYLDAATALALIAFLGTVAFARFLNAQRRDEANEINGAQRD